MDGFKMGVSFELGEEHEFDLGLGGQVQEGNVQMALAAMYRLGQNGFKFDVEAILRGLENVKELSGIRGRLDVVSEKPLVVCDVAHNEEALRLLFPHITRFHEIDHIIYSCTNDRDLNEFIPTFPEGAVLHFVRSSNPRLTDPKELLEIGERADFECYAYDSVAEGIESVLQKNPSCLVITGSNFLVAEALEFPWP